MFEQINLFDLFERESERKFSWDDDINEIHRRLKELARKYNLEIAREEWKVWGHVPQFGYRMSIGLVVTRDIVDKDDFWDDLNKIIEEAKSKQVELSPFQPYFFGGRNTTTMSIFTTFMDLKRQKRKEW